MYQKRVSIGILILLMQASLYALPSDKTKLIQVQADSADLNNSSHKNYYSGNVKFSQGSTNLQAAKAETHSDEKNEIVYAEAQGDEKEQAHYWTLTAEDKPPLHAYANVIKYFHKEHRIELWGKARIEQGKNSFEGPVIHYHTKEQRILSKTDGKSQSSIIFYPEKKNS